MNRTNLDEIFNCYIDRFDELNDPDSHDEGYKWRAVSCFTENWDIDAENFAEMFKSAMKETGVLIDNATVQPVGGILFLLKYPDEVEFVRECFRELYSDDNGDIDARQARVYTFIEKINSAIEKYAKGSWKYPQKVNNVLSYLSLRYPADNYIFKSKVAEEWANCSEYGDDFGSGQDFSLAKYYKMCDELLRAVQENLEIMRLNKARFDKYAKGYDDKCHILVYDIIYCAHTYGFYTEGMLRTTAKQRVAKAKEYEKAQSLKNEILEKEEEIRRYKAENTMPNMVGMTVKYKYGGVGTVVEQTEDFQIVSFDGVEKKLGIPSSYTAGFLRTSEEIMQSICEYEAKIKKIESLENELKLLKRQH